MSLLPDDPEETLKKIAPFGADEEEAEPAPLESSIEPAPQVRPKDYSARAGDPNRYEGKLRDWFKSDVRGAQATKTAQDMFDRVLARNQEAQTRAAASKQAAEEKQKTRELNTKNEEEWVRSGVKYRQYSDGVLRPDRDANGNLVFDPETSEITYDDQGRAVQSTRDKTGTVTTKDVDNEAPIGTHPERPHELYKQNKHRAWELVGTIDTGMQSADPRIKTAAEKGQAGLEKDFGKTVSESLKTRAAQITLDTEAARTTAAKHEAALPAAQQKLAQAKTALSNATGVRAWFRSTPPDEVALLRGAVDSAQREVDTVMAGSAFDPLAFESQAAQVKQDEEMWKALVQTTGSVSAAAKRRREMILEAKGDPAKDPILSAITSRRKALGMSEYDAEEQKQAEAEMRKHPTLGPKLAERDALQKEEQDLANSGDTDPAKRAALDAKKEQFKQSLKATATQAQADADKAARGPTQKALDTLDTLAKERAEKKSTLAERAMTGDLDAGRELDQEPGYQEFKKNLLAQAKAEGWAPEQTAAKNEEAVRALLQPAQREMADRAARVVTEKGQRSYRIEPDKNAIDGFRVNTGVGKEFEDAVLDAVSVGDLRPVDGQQLLAQKQSDEKAMRETLIAGLKRDRGLDDTGAQQAITTLNPDEMERMLRRADVEDFGSTSFQRAAAQGWLNLGASAANFTRIFAESEWAKKNATQLEQMAQSIPQEVQSYRDVKSISDAGSYAAAALGQLAPSMAVSMAGGVAVKGAMAALPATARLATAATRATELATKARTAGDVARATQLTERAAKIAKLSTAMETWGGRGGAFLTSTVQEAGSIYGTMESNGISERLTALGFGALAGALDSITTGNVIERISKAAGKDGARAIMTTTLRELGKAAAKDIPMEGVTEGAQTVIEKLAEGLANDSLDEIIADPNAFHEVVDSFLMGVIGGGAMSAGTAPMTARSQRKAAQRAEASYAETIKPAVDAISALHATLPPTNDVLAKVPETISPFTREMGGAPREGLATKMQAADAEIASLQEQLATTEQTGDLGARNTLAQRLAQTQQGKIELANTAYRTEATEAAAQEIDGLTPDNPALAGYDLQMTQDAARGLVKITSGMPIDALTRAEQDALAAPAPDGSEVVRVEAIKGWDKKEHLIITQGAIDRLAALTPRAAELIGQNEAERRRSVTTPPPEPETAPKAAGKPSPATPPQGEESQSASPGQQSTAGAGEQSPAPARELNAEEQGRVKIIAKNLEKQGAAPGAAEQFAREAVTETGTSVPMPQQLTTAIEKRTAAEAALGTFEVSVEGEAAPRIVKAASEAEARALVAGDSSTKGMVGEVVMTQAPKTPQSPAPTPTASEPDAPEFTTAKTQLETALGRPLNAREETGLREVVSKAGPEIRRWNGVFTGGVNWQRVFRNAEGRPLRTGGAQVDTESNTLMLSIADIARNGRSLITDGGIEQVIGEEAIHVVSEELHRLGVIDIDAMWSELPEEVKDLVRGRVEKRGVYEVKAGANRDAVLAREWWRLFIQGSMNVTADGWSVDGKPIVTEQITPSFLAKIRDALTELFRVFSNLREELMKLGASAEYVDAVEQARDLTLARLKSVDGNASSSFEQDSPNAESTLSPGRPTGAATADTRGGSGNEPGTGAESGTPGAAVGAGGALSAVERAGETNPTGSPAVGSNTPGQPAASGAPAENAAGGGVAEAERELDPEGAPVRAALRDYFTGRMILVSEGTFTRPLANYLPAGSPLAPGATIGTAIERGWMGTDGKSLWVPDEPAPPTPSEPASTPDAGPAPATSEEAPPPTEKPARSFRFRLPEAPGGTPDMLDHLIDNYGKIRSAAAARKAGKSVGGEYDGASYLPGGVWWNAIFTSDPSSGNRPDEAAQVLYEMGLLKDASPDTLWEALKSAIQSRKKIAGETRGQGEQVRQIDRFQKDAIDPANAEDADAILVDDLKVGDIVTVNGEALEVTVVNATSGAVTLRDGKRYGVQRVDAGKVIYGELEETESDTIPEIDPNQPFAQDQVDDNNPEPYEPSRDDRATDPITGARTRLTGRPVTAEDARRVAADDARALLGWDRRVQGLVSGGSVQGYDRVRFAAGFNATIGQPTPSLAALQVELTAAGLSRSGGALRLETKGAGREAMVVGNDQFVYKLVNFTGQSYGLDGVVNIGPQVMFSSLEPRGTIRSWLERATLLSKLGTPTEIVGITTEGVLVIKQPNAPAWQWNSPQLDAELDRLGAIKMPVLPGVNFGGEYLFTIDGKPWLAMDADGPNIRADSNGKPRFIDPVFAPVPDAAIARSPFVAEFVRQAREREQSAGDRSAMLFAQDQSQPGFDFGQAGLELFDRAPAQQTIDTPAAQTPEVADAARTGDVLDGPIAEAVPEITLQTPQPASVPTEVPSRFALRNPIKGTTGAAIVGYEWRSTMGEKWSEREGGLVDARVSDWDNADESRGTGRAIVHVYYIKHPDGRTTIEGIQSAQNILGISETRLQVIAKRERAAQAYAEEQDRLDVEAAASVAKDTPTEAARQYRVGNYSSMRSFEENDAIFNESILFEKDGKYVRRGPGATERMERFGWKVVTNDPAKAVLNSVTPTSPVTAQVSDFGEKIGGARKDTAKPLGARHASIPKANADQPGWRRKYVAAQVMSRGRGQYDATAGRWVNGIETPTGKWTVMRTDGVNTRSPQFATEAEAEAAIPLVEVSRNHGVSYTKANREAQPVWHIYRKIGDHKRPVVKDGFASDEEARAYMAIHPEEIIEHKFAFPEVPWLDRLNRTGGAQRTKDVTAQMFQETFGFRGGEFGNWNMGAEGQASLNHAFDGLRDLADMLGIQPKALSLNGELAIAFGARGTGGKDAAKAHYEPGYVVINLTKIRGAGSLAHEWFHALDHYLGRQDGKAGDRVENAKASGRDAAYVLGEYVSHGFSRTSGVREALREKFKAVMDAMTAKTVETEVPKDSLQKIASQQNEWVKDNLAQIRQQFTSYHVYSKKKVPATAEQLQAFDEIAAKITAGDAGEIVFIEGQNRSSAGRQSFAAIERLNLLYKSVLGRGFTSGENSLGKKLFWQIRSAKDAAARVATTEDAATETRKIATEYLRESRKIDNLRVENYWSTPHEMGARAFAAFVHDKLTGQNRESQYLVHSSDNRLYFQLFGLKPYPEGKERQRINEAWEALWSAVDQRETPKGVALYAQDQTEMALGDFSLVDGQWVSSVDREASAAAPKPTDAQKEAGNYPKGHARISGLDITIENAAGTKREGTNKNGEAWSVTMGTHYGYIRGTEGRDGDHVDVLIKPGTSGDWTGAVFVVNQQNASGGFDEHKAVLGAATEEEARALYASNYSPGWKVGPITRLSMDRFKAWLAEGDTTKPLKPEKTWVSTGSPAALVRDNLANAEAMAGRWSNIPGVDADEVRQTARIGLFKAARGFQPDKGDFGAYARRAITNELRSLYQKRVGDRNLPILDEPLGDGADGETGRTMLPDESADTQRAVTNEEAGQVLDRVIADLPENLRVVVDGLRAGRTLEEIGEGLDGLSKQAIFNRSKMAFAQLRRKLGELGIRGTDDLMLSAQPQFDDTPLDNLMRMLDLEALGDLAEKAQAEKPGEFTTGRPDLALGAKNADIRAVDEWRKGNVEAQTHEEWEQDARTRLNRDYEGEMQKIVRIAMMPGGQLNPVETKMAQMIIAEESEKPRSDEQRRRLQSIAWANRQTGTEQARSFGARRDREQSPEARNRLFLTKAIYTPPTKVRAKIEAAKTPAEKQRLLDADAERIAKIEAELKKMGVNLDDILAGEVVLRLKGTPIVQNIVQTFDEKRQKAFRLLQGGTKTFDEVAKEVGLKPAEVEAVRDQFVAEFRRKHFEKFKKGTKAEQIDAGLAAPGPGMLSAQDPGVSDAEAEAEFEKALRMMGIVPKTDQGAFKVVKRKRRKASASPESSTGQPPSDSPVGPMATKQGDLLNPERNADRMPTDVSPVGGTSGTQPDLLKVPYEGPTPSDAPTGPAADKQGDLLNPERNADRAPLATPVGNTDGKQEKLFPPEPPFEEWMYRKELADPAAVARVARMAQAATGNGWDMLHEYWINNILSGPATHAANIAGNALATAWDFTVQRGTEALLNLAYRDAQGAQLGEFKHLLTAIAPGVARGWKLARMAWEAEADFFKATVLDQQIEMFDEYEKGGGVRPAIPGKAGRVVRMPGRSLLFMDSLFKGIIGQMEASAQAYRMARADGLKGDALTRRMRALVNTPGSEAWQRAVEKAVELTFQEKSAIGEITGGIKGMKDRPEIGYQIAGRLFAYVMPFVNTPWNIFKMGMRKTPVGTLNMLARFGHAGFVKIRNGKPIAETYLPGTQIKHLAEQVIGWGAMALLWGFAQGDEDDEEKKWLVTGSMPFKETTRGERELQQRAYGGSYMIRIGGRGGFEFNYGRYEPIATALGTVVDMIRSLKRGTPAADKLDALWGYFVAQAQGKTFLQAQADMIASLQDGTGMSDKAKRAFAQGLVPNIIRQPLRNLDDFARDQKDAAFAYQLLPAASNAPAKLDVYGKPVEKGGNALSRLVITSGTKPDDIQTAADKLLLRWNQQNPTDKWAPSPPERTYKAGKETKQMTGAEYARFSALVGRKVNTLLAGRIGPAAVASPKEADVKAIQNAFERARREAKAELFPDRPKVNVRRALWQ